MPVDEKKRILLVRQYRLPARQYLVGAAGRAAWMRARRRCRPRAANWSKRPDIARRSWKKLAEFYPSPGFLAEKMTIYLATDLTAGEADADGRRAHRDALVHARGRSTR